MKLNDVLLLLMEGTLIVHPSLLQDLVAIELLDPGLISK